MNNRSHDNDDNRANRRSRRLYKNPDAAKVCGVCAGLAEYFDLETWVVRVITISFVLFSSGTAVLAYFFACFIMDTKPGTSSNSRCFVVWPGKREHSSSNSDPEQRRYSASVNDVWKKGYTPAETLQKVEITFENIERKLQRLETYVTSNKYHLEKEFQKMS